MKKRISLGMVMMALSALIVFLGLHHSTRVNSQDRTGPVIAGVDELLLPSTYKDGEDVVLYLSGKIEEPCASIKEVEVVRNRKFVGIRPIVNDKIDYDKCQDKFAPVYYEKPVRLKGIPYGRHQIYVSRSNGATLQKDFDRNSKNLFESYLSPGVNMEAPLASIQGKEVEINLKGFLPNGCHRPDFAEVYVDDDIIKVYPNALKRSSNEICTDQLVPYEVSVKTEKLMTGRYMIWLMDGETTHSTEKVLDVFRNDVEYVKFNEKESH